MTDPQRRAPPKLSAMRALGCVAFAALAVFLVGQLQVGVPSCPLCTTSGNSVYCNNNDLMYCNGGLPVLGATLSVLTVAAVGFGVFATGASRRDWHGEARTPGMKRALLAPNRRWTIGLALIFDGAAVASLGLWMVVPPLYRVCTEPCGPAPYYFTGIPLALAVVGAVMIVPGLLLLLLSLRPHRESIAVRTQINRST